MNVAEPAGQAWSASDYARHGRFVAELAGDLVDALDPKFDERVLDLGCGDGELALRIAERGAQVVGVDASLDMVAACTRRGVEAHVLDAQHMPYREEFDAVFSNAALHWMKRDPQSVLDGVARALKPGGRFVAELGGAGNVASVRAAIHAVLGERGVAAAALDPWFFPSDDAYRALIEASGLTVVELRSFRRPTPLSGDLTGWLRTFARAFLQALPEDQRDAAIDDIVARVRPQLRDAHGSWTVDYVRLRVRAVKQRQQA